MRYSITNPDVFLQSNLVGFFNIIDLCKSNKIRNFVYASSSSVYGENKKASFSINEKTDNPISFYAATKKTNELIAKSYSNMYDLNTTGLRYFTVYGPWGRPDMSYFIFTKKILSRKHINVFNHGNIMRDFTFIDDIIAGTKAAIKKNFNNEIFNLGSSKKNNIVDIIKIIEKKLSLNAKIRFVDKQIGDPNETFADIKESKEKLNFFPKTSIKDGIEKFLNWYQEYYD